MDEERLGSDIDFARKEWIDSLPEFVRNLPILPENLFTEHVLIKECLRQGKGFRSRPINKYFEELNLTGEEQSYVLLTLSKLACPTINGKFVNQEVTINMAKTFVKAGLLEVLDQFRENAVMRETARRLLGL